MKHLFIMLFMVFTVTNATAQANAYLQHIKYLQMRVTDDYMKREGNGNKPSKAPMRRPTIGISENTLYLYGQFGALTLELADNGTTVYSTIVEANADVVNLPDDMSGSYVLLLNDGGHIYSCEIVLE